MSVGGICGSIYDTGTIKNCYNLANLEGFSKTKKECSIAGIVAFSRTDTIQNCYNFGNITGNSEKIFISGILAREDANGLNLNNTYNIGNIIIQSEKLLGAGGIMGSVSGANHANINNAYNIGTIKMDNLVNEHIGSIAGNDLVGNELITFNNCYYLKGTYDVGAGGNDTAIGVTELDDDSEFPIVLEVINGEGAFKKDFNNINNGYPILEWQ